MTVTVRAERTVGGAEREEGVQGTRGLMWELTMAMILINWE